MGAMAEQKYLSARTLAARGPLLLAARDASSTTSSLPGTRHAACVRSPHAHARVGAIDPVVALGVPRRPCRAHLARHARPDARGPHPAARPRCRDPGAAHAVLLAVDEVAQHGEASRMSSPRAAMSPRTQPRSSMSIMNVLQRRRRMPRRAHAGAPVPTDRRRHLCRFARPHGNVVAAFQARGAPVQVSCGSIATAAHAVESRAHSRPDSRQRPTARALDRPSDAAQPRAPRRAAAGLDPSRSASSCPMSAAASAPRRCSSSRRR